MPQTKLTQIPALPPDSAVPRQEKTAIVLIALALLLFGALQVYHDEAQTVYGHFNSNHVAIHTVLEFSSIFVSFSIALQGWMVFTHTLSKQRLLFACTFLAVGLLDVLHTMSFPGMPYFFAESSSNIATWFWIAARFTEGGMLLLVMIVPESQLQDWQSRRKAMLLAAIYTLLVSSLIYLSGSHLPALLQPDGRTTALKNILEYSVCGIHGIVLIVVFYAYRKYRFATGLNVILACVLLILSELLQTTYNNPFDVHNLVGHFFKVLGFISFLLGFYFSTFQNPYQVLEKKREELSLLTSSLGEGIFVLDLQGRVQFMNPEAERLLGWQQGELIGETLFSKLFFVRSTGGFIDSRQGKAGGELQPGSVYRNDDDMFRRKNGSLLPVSYTVTPIVENGKTVATVTVFRDISERKRAEQLLKESEKQYRLISDNSLDMISKLTPDGICFYVSPSCRTLVGYEPEDLIGHNGTEFYHPDDVDRVLAEHAGILGDTKQIFTSPYRFRRKDGTYIWLETTARIIVDDKTGALKEILAISRNVTDRKLHMEAIQQLTTRNKLILDSVAEGIFGTGMDRKILFCNPAAARMLGYAAEELLGKDPKQTFNPAAPLEPAVYHEQFRSKGYFSTEAVFHRKDGSCFPVEYIVTPMYDNGQLIGIVSTFNDLTQRKQTEQLAEERLQIDLEMSLASNVQKGLLQETDQIPVPAGIEIGVTSKTTGKLNGDFYNFADTKESFIFGIADISGKGMPAAILMSMMKFAMDEFSTYDTRPNIMLDVLNRFVYKYTDPSIFVTMFMGSYDKQSSHFYYSNAGQEPAIWYRAATGEAIDLNTEGAVLGLAREQVYGVHSVKLEPGDIILMYTDGVIENRSSQEIDSNDILKKLLQEVDLAKPMQDIAQHICKRVGEINGPPVDDQTLLLFRRK